MWCQFTVEQNASIGYPRTYGIQIKIISMRQEAHIGFENTCYDRRQIIDKNSRCNWKAMHVALAISAWAYIELGSMVEYVSKNCRPYCQCLAHSLKLGVVTNTYSQLWTTLMAPVNSGTWRAEISQKGWSRVSKKSANTDLTPWDDARNQIASATWLAWQS